MSGIDDLISAIEAHAGGLGGESSARKSFVEEFGETAKKDCATHLKQWGLGDPSGIRMRGLEKDKDDENYHPENKFYIQVCHVYYRDDTWKINIILDWAENKIIKHHYQLIARCKFKEREEIEFRGILGDDMAESDMPHIQWLFRQFSSEINLKKDDKNKTFESMDIN